MDIEKFLTGTEFENLIPKFHEEGIANVNDLRVLHSNGKLIDLCKKITNSPSDSIKLKNLIQKEIGKWFWYLIAGLIIIMVIMYLTN